jgi:hypothetical protein
VCLILVPRFAGSNQAENDGFSRAIKICSTTPFGGEIKPPVPFVRLYGMLKIPAGYAIDTYRLNSRTFLVKFLCTSLLGVSAGICQRALVDKPGMIRTPMGTQNRSKWPQCMGRFV